MENNLLNMISDLSSKLKDSNPDLQDIVTTMMSGKISSAEEIQEYIISKYPKKKEEILKGFNAKDVESKINKLKEIQEQFSKLCL